MTMKKALSISLIAFTSFLGVFIGVIAGAPAAQAHAGLVSTNPQVASEITVMPEQVTLTFTEELLTLGGKDVNTLSLKDPNGTEIALTDIAVSGAVLSASIPTADYPSGSYEVQYKIVSADGHKLESHYTFSLNAPTLLGEPAATPAPAASSESKVLPLPIVGAIVVVILLGGLFAFRSFNRSK